jgi:hypothetical protein
MKISEVLAISGKPGLFKVVASSSKNLVVESMLDNKRTSVPGSVRISSLSDITMYTTKDDVALRTILHSMHKKTKGEAAISHNASAGDIKEFVDSNIPSEVLASPIVPIAISFPPLVNFFEISASS